MQPPHPEPHTPFATERDTQIPEAPRDWQSGVEDWGGLRPKLQERGVSVELGLYGDWFKNIRGGANTEDLDFMHLTSLSLSLDTQRLFGLNGGTVFINAMHIGGDNPSDNVGDWQWVSSLAADRRDQIAEVWYEQKLLDETLRIKLGKIDAYAEFDQSEVGQAFLNSSSDMSPTMPGFPTYPDPSFGAVVEYIPCEPAYVRLGVFDGATQEGKSLGDDGARSLFGGPSDLVFLGEIGTAWAYHDLPGRAAVGMSWHTGTFNRFDGGTDNGMAGYYVVAEQMLSKEAPDDEEDLQGTSAFFRAGLTDGQTQDVVYHVGGGVVAVGIIPERDDDSIGFALNFVGFSNETNAPFVGDELNIELFYSLQLTRFLSVQPDVQYIINPNGDPSLDDALAIGVRFSLEL